MLNADSPAYIGGIPALLVEPEMFDQFEQRLESGQRTWWDEASHEFIHGVSSTGRPFYTRLIPGGLSQIPGLTAKLEGGATVAELACGAGVGLVRIAHSYPKSKLFGVDGNRFPRRFQVINAPSAVSSASGAEHGGGMGWCVDEERMVG